MHWLLDGQKDDRQSCSPLCRHQCREPVPDETTVCSTERWPLVSVGSKGLGAATARLSGGGLQLNTGTSLASGVRYVTEETIRMFLQHYRRPRLKRRGRQGAG
jgi:hypothetical protein